MDIALRKPLLATAGADSSVRIWNYVERSLEVMRVYGEPIYSVAMHPSGLHIIVAFADKLRLLNILMEDLRDVKEFAIRASNEVRFSNGGHLFAAANGAARRRDRRAADGRGPARRVHVRRSS